MSTTVQIIEIRCPQGPKSLLAKVRADGGTVHVRDGLMEFSCRDCTRRARRSMESAGLNASFRVLHRFDFAGALIESLQEPL